MSSFKKHVATNYVIYIYFFVVLKPVKNGSVTDFRASVMSSSFRNKEQRLEVPGDETPSRSQSQRSL